MSSKGWFKVHRGIREHWVWDCEFSHGQAWIDLIAHACHKDNKLSIKGQLISLTIGQQARSEITLSKEWKWSRNKVRRFLKNLEADGMISQKKTHLTSIITICNYTDFQSTETTGETTKGQHSKQQKDNTRNTNKNVKNSKNVKELFDAERIIPIWNSLGCKKHNGLTEKAAKALDKTYSAYRKAADEPKELNDWLEVYLENGFSEFMTDHHRDLKDGKWAADLEFAVRFDTYDKIKNTVE